MEALKYTLIDPDTFKQLQRNSGVLLTEFDPENATTVKQSSILFSTTGDLSFSDSISTKDLGEDINNCPKNMLELKSIESHEVKLSGTGKNVNAAKLVILMGAADAGVASANKVTTVMPRNDLDTKDFKKIWWVSDYGDNGFVAIEIDNALNTGGFQMDASDKSTGTFPFEFTAHYSMDAQNDVPYKIYLMPGGGEE